MLDKVMFKRVNHSLLGDIAYSETPVFFFNPLTTNSHTTQEYELLAKAKQRYKAMKLPSLHPNRRANLSSPTSSPTRAISLFCWFTFNLKTSSIQTTHIQYLNLSTLSSQMSFANNKQEIFILAPPSTLYLKSSLLYFHDEAIEGFHNQHKEKRITLSQPSKTLGKIVGGNIYQD